MLEKLLVFSGSGLQTKEEINLCAERGHKRLENYRQEANDVNQDNNAHNVSTSFLVSLIPRLILLHVGITFRRNLHSNL